MNTPTRNGATKRQQMPAITANETASPGALSPDTVVPTEWGPHIKGRYVAVRIDPSDPSRLIIELQAWHVEDGIWLGAGQTSNNPAEDLLTFDAVGTKLNSLVVDINETLAEVP